MKQPESGNHWDEINGGLRGSTLLHAGGLMTIVATTGNLASEYLMANGGMTPAWLVTGAWLCWILALWLIIC